MSFSASRIVCVFVSRWSTLAWAVVASALSVVGEVLYGELAFVCPCTPGGQNVWAATVGVLVPSVLLFVGGCFLQGDAWRVLRGCCRSYCDRNSTDGDAESRAPRASAGARKEIGRVLEAVLVLVARALVAPVSWIVAALLSGVYFACGQSERVSRLRYSSLTGMSDYVIESLLYKIPCQNIDLTNGLNASQQSNIRAEVLASLHATSQLIGLGLLSAIALVAALIVSIPRCTSHVSEQEASFSSRYRAIESAVFADEADALARSLAEERCRAVLLGVRAAYEAPQDDQARRAQDVCWLQLSGVRRVLTEGGGQRSIQKPASRDGVDLSEYADADPVYAN